MNKVERKHELERKFEETRHFDKDVMEREAEITSRAKDEKNQNFRVDLDKQWKREIWESQKKCGRESAVRVDVFSHGGKLEHVTVSETKEGKPFKSEFNSLLEPVAGGTSPASLVEEHRKNLDGFMKGEFFKHAMGEESYIGKIDDNWSITIPVRMARFMGLEGGMSFKFGWEGDSLVLTPIGETEMPMKIQLGTTLPQNIRGGRASLIVGIPPNMLFIAGLKLGDYAAWSEKEGLLCLRKAEKDAPYARKIHWIGGSIGGISAGTTIPAEMAEKAHVEPGQYGFWTFEDLNKSLWLEVRGTRNIAKIIKVEREGGAKFSIRIPEDMRGRLEKGDEVALEVKDGNIYVTKQQLES
jgi:hypothetical protein